MSVNKPFKRTCRIFTDGSYRSDGKWQYIYHSDYAEAPKHYIRAFLFIQKDLLNFFDYIEPSDLNGQTHSFRIHELLLRTCIEVEANCKAILRENEYLLSARNHWNMQDYKKIEQSHYLSQMEVKISNWIGQNNCRRPFAPWEAGDGLSWYQAYNATKHDRHMNFEAASFDNLMNAVCALAALMASQFLSFDFDPEFTLCFSSPNQDGYEPGIGDLFRIKFPSNVPAEARYNFNWNEVQQHENPFQNFVYTS